MKIGCSQKFIAHNGPNLFMSRLLHELKTEFGCDLVPAKEPCDIHLCSIQGKRKTGSANVVRIDGVYYDKARLKSNNPIRNTINSFDGVVFQSHWSKKMALNLLSAKPKNDVVIHNGIDQSIYNKNHKSNDKEGFDKIFISCAQWRPNKRPVAIQKAFIKANDASDLNLGLFMVGSNDKKIQHPNIKHFNQVSPKKLIDLYAKSDYMIHICHIDSCSNSVVEGLSFGLPVLCNNIGGTPEIVRESGLIASIDKKIDFPFRPIKDMKSVGSKSVDINILCDYILKMTKENWDIDRPDLDIMVAAKKYYDFFEKILS